MKFASVILFFLLSSTSCAPRKVENPGANAKTYSAEEYSKECNEILNAEKAQKLGISVETKTLEGQVVLFKINFPQSIKSMDEVKVYRKAILEVGLSLV